jgi:hypothetical protein
MGVAETNQTFTLIFIIHGLLQLYNKCIYSNLIKMKVLFMASTCKATFNIDGLTIHLTLNIPIQQSLFDLPKLSTNTLNILTCQYEKLQLVVIDEISLVGARMINVINNRLKFIKHIQIFFFVVLISSRQVIFIKHHL